MTRNMITAGFALAAALLAAPAWADETANAAPATNADESVIDLAELATLSGGDGVDISTVTAQTLRAVSSGNTVRATNVGSGDVQISENAFQDFTGIGNFIINTGHNNTLQSSLNVNIVLAP